MRVTPAGVTLVVVGEPTLYHEQNTSVSYMFLHLCKTVNEITNLVSSHGTLRKEKPVQRHLNNLN